MKLVNINNLLPDSHNIVNKW